jgi:ABC-type uncharacterized transport system substrate-binding protein
MARKKRVLALAVGDPRFSQLIDHPSKLYGVRPYISGLIHGLTKLGRALGSEYVIDYRQNWLEHIDSGHAFRETQNPALVYAMSTSVTRAAGKHINELPLVFSNCSQHAAEELVKAKRATGFSARRTQTAGECFERFFKTVPTLKEVVILHKPDYDVSDHAVQLVTKAAEHNGVKSRTLTVRSHSDLREKLEELPERASGAAATVGVHVTPVDLLFAATPWIIRCVQETKNLPAFFPVTDWVPNGLGGFGVSQFRCGERTAKHVDQVVWPAKPRSSLPRVLEATKGDFEWAVSRAAAEALGLKPPTAADVRIV